MNDAMHSEQPAETAVVVEAEPSAVAGMGAVRLIALLFSLAACWLARDLLVPIMLGMLLALLANPMVTRLTRIWIPRWLGALVVVLGGLALAVSLASLLVGPASDWVKQAPTELRQLAPKLKKLTRQVEQANKAAASIVSAAGAAPTANSVAADVDKPRPPNLWTLISGAPAALASVLAVVLLSYFFLVYGEGLQRHAIARLTGPEKKLLTIDILRTIESDLSRYVQTISFINVALGLVLTGGLYWLGLDIADALLWGTLAALLNFVPYVGPLSWRDPAGPGRRGRLRQAGADAGAASAVPGPARTRVAIPDAGDPGPAHGDLAAGDAAVADALGLPVGHRRTVAGGTDAGQPENRRRTDRGMARLGQGHRVGPQGFTLSSPARVNLPG